MYKFMLVVEESLDDTITDRELCKVVMRPKIPIIGEVVTFSGNQYRVTDIIHDFDAHEESPSAIQVITT